MRKTLLLLLFIASSAFCSAQDDSLKTVKAKNAVFFEIFGSGLIYSLNYERVFENRFTLRGGASHLEDSIFDTIGRFPISSSYLIPMENYLMPTDMYSHIEVGVGSTLLLKREELAYAFGPLLGLRIQDLMEGGGYFRITFTPFLNVDENDMVFNFFWGISFGTSF